VTAWLAPAEHPYLAVAGWALLLALWETTVIALLVGAWLALRPSRSPEAQHATAAAAMLAALLAVAFTPIVMSWPEGQPPPATIQAAMETGEPRASQLVTPQGTMAARQSPVGLEPGRSRWRATVGWLGLAWLVGASAILIRLGVGYASAAGLRRRATACGDPRLTALVECQRVVQGVGGGICLLESRQVAGPVVVGWSRPAIVLPADLTSIVDAEAIESILAHEVAHVRRRDYAVNLLQRVIEAVLFFCPGIAWISNRAREAREFCCDDAALRHGGGNPRSYARALASLASAGSRPRAAMAVVGPPLTTRVLRLLEGDRMSLTLSHRLAFAISLVVVLLAGGPVSTLTMSGGRAAVAEALDGMLDEPGARTPLAAPGAGQAAQTRTPTSPTRASRPGLPEANDTSVETDRVESRAATTGGQDPATPQAGNAGQAAADPAGASATATEVLLSVTWPEALRGRLPQTIETATLHVPEGESHNIAFRAPPGIYGEFGVRPTVIDEGQGLVRVDILTPHLGRSLAPYFSVDESIELVVGGEGALSAATRFTFAVTEIRQAAGTPEAAFLPITPTRRPPGDTVQAPFPSSPTLAARPGPPDPEVAQASAFRPRTAGRPVPIVLRIGLPGGLAEPVLTLTTGTTGTLQLPDESAFGFRPTRFSFQSRPGFRPVVEVVRVEILDLSTTPWTSLGVVDIPGSRTVQSTTSPTFAITVVDPSTRDGR
jgi:beta-lactamase regulating signal transducer with metallopeptidase domain